MWILVVEAGVALFLLVFVVWWTMFQGKGKAKGKPAGRRDDSGAGQEHEQRHD